jgi:hypothetical protein
MRPFKLLILSLILAIIETSCSANYHLNKAIKKGYRCEVVADTITISSIDSIPYAVKDSIYWEKIVVQKDTIIRQMRSFVPKTRYQTRIEYKLKRDTLRLIEKQVVYKYKKDKKDSKKPNLWLFIIGFGIGFLTKWLMRFAKYTL